MGVCVEANRHIRHLGLFEMHVEMFTKDVMIFKPYIRRNAQMMPANGIKRQMLPQILRANM